MTISALVPPFCTICFTILLIKPLSGDYGIAHDGGSSLGSAHLTRDCFLVFAMYQIFQLLFILYILPRFYFSSLFFHFGSD